MLWPGAEVRARPAITTAPRGNARATKPEPTRFVAGRRARPLVALRRRKGTRARMLKGLAAIIGVAAAVLLLISVAIGGYHVVHWLKHGNLGDVITTRAMLSLLLATAFTPRTA